MRGLKMFLYAGAAGLLGLGFSRVRWSDLELPPGCHIKAIAREVDPNVAAFFVLDDSGRLLAGSQSLLPGVAASRQPTAVLSSTLCLIVDGESLLQVQEPQPPIVTQILTSPCASLERASATRCYLYHGIVQPNVLDIVEVLNGSNTVRILRFFDAGAPISAVAGDGRDFTFVASQGRVYLVAPNHDVQLVYFTGGEQITSLSLAPNGCVFFSTSNKGGVIHGPGQGTVFMHAKRPRLLCDVSRDELWVVTDDAVSRISPASGLTIASSFQSVK